MLFAIFLFCGVFGFISNILVLGPLIKITSYHKAAYVLLASIVTSDICTCLALGCWSGAALLFDLSFISDNVNCFVCIWCQFVTILSYPTLGVFLWKCTGQCRRSPLRKITWFHRTEVAIGICLMIWFLSTIAGIVAISPTPVIQLNTRLGSISFVRQSIRAQTILWLVVWGRVASFVIQWVCNVRVIGQIYGNGVQGSCREYRDQIQLFLQYFFPSVVFTLSIWTYCLLPIENVHRDKKFTKVFQLLWLVQSAICPCCYFMVNNRLRHSVKSVICLRPTDPASVALAGSQQLYSASEYSTRSTSRKVSKTKQKTIQTKMIKRCTSELGNVNYSKEEIQYRSKTCIFQKQYSTTTDKAYSKVQFVTTP